MLYTHLIFCFSVLFFRIITIKIVPCVCSTSVYNLNEEEEEEEVPTKEKVEENDKMKEKLDQLRVNMEKMSLTRKVSWHRVLIACNY